VIRLDKHWFHLEYLRVYRNSARSDFLVNLFRAELKIEESTTTATVSEARPIA